MNVYRPGPRRQRLRTQEKSGSSAVCYCAPASYGRTIGRSTYVWASGHFVLASDAASLSRSNGVFSRRRTNRAVAMPSRARARGVRYHPMSSCGRLDAGPSFLWPRRMGLSAPAPPLAWHESMTAKRQRGGGDAARASSWAGRRGGEAASGPLIVRVQRELLPVL